MNSGSLYIIFIFFTIGRTWGFQLLKDYKHKCSSRALLLDLSSMSSDSKPIIIEILSKKTLSDIGSIQKSDTRIVSSFDSVYQEAKEDKVVEIMDSPALKVVGILFNPSTLVLALYLSSIGWSKVLWLQKFLSVFGRGTLVKRPGETAKPVEELPFQTFECEVCKMEMRPARGRAEIIFGRERFRCSRCGSKASAYFNIDDMDDERAVARLERLKNEAEAEVREVDDDDDIDVDGEESDDIPPTPSATRKKIVICPPLSGYT